MTYKGWLTGSLTKIILVFFAASVFLLAHSATASALPNIKVSGTVTKQNGDWINNVTVTATLPGSSTVAYGPVVTSGLGTYSIYVDAGIYDLHFTPPAGSAHDPTVKTDVTVLGETTLNIQLLQLPKTLSGRITSSDGSPLPNVGVLVEANDGQKNTCTDANGTYTLSLKPQNYRISLWASNTTLNGCSQYVAPPNTDAPNDFTIRTQSQWMESDLTNGNVVRDFSLPTAKLTLYGKNSYGEPYTSPRQLYTDPTDYFESAIVSGGSSTLPFGKTRLRPTSLDASGKVSGYVIKGTRFPANTICLNTLAATYCNLTPLTVNDESTVTLQEPVQLAPSTPSGLQAATPTKQKSFLSWSSVAHASNYVVYRNGTQVAEVGTTNFTDNALVLGGSYSYTVAAKSPNGLSSAPSASVTVLYDPDAPVLTNLTVNPSTINIGSSAILSASVTDTLSPVSFVEYFEGSDPGIGNGSRLTIVNGLASTTLGSNLNYGVHILNVRARDSLGNANSPIAVQLTVKLPAPTGLAASTPARSPSLSWSSVAAADHYSVMRDGVVVGTVNGTLFTDSTATDGTHSYQVAAVTSNDISSDLSSSVSVLVDNTAPVITYTVEPTLNSDGWGNQNLTVTFTCDDSNGSGVANCTSPVTINDEGGNQNVLGSVTDAAGNTASTTATVSVDKTVPTISYTLSNSANNDGWHKDDVTVEFTCNDSLSGVKVCPQPIVISSDANNQTITGVVTDYAGNSSSTSTVINLDKTAPNITYSLSPVPNGSSWNKENVLVTFTCSDSTSGIKSCPAPLTIGSEGAGQTFGGTATDYAGNTQSINSTVSLDKTAPVLSAVSWSSNPLAQGQSTTLSVTANDSLSGTASTYFTIDGGAQQPLTFDSASGAWKATIGSSLLANTYNFEIYAIDNAGNVSGPLLDVLAVYNSANGYVSGHARTLPTASDVLPITRDISNNPAKLAIGFTNVTAPTSGSFDVGYIVKNNQNEFNLSSTSISWVVVPDGTHASIMGHADLTTYVNGVQTVVQGVSVRFDMSLGTNGGPDHITVKVWSPTQNPATDAPTYLISDDALLNASQIFIR